eukprot:TRINITY_DN25_c2_g1_i1.p1 TRINITY_DN25_c2_g1~~TRINITY_DN25_c2_g1_i1.p1  ORF type:complete len:404 (+),score=196.09 TRINITY_DN25_c2_g1_i1:35-1213(+)
MYKLALLLVLFVIGVYSQSWNVVDKDYATIAMSTSFVAPSTGYIGGGSASLQPLVYYTTTAGQNLTNLGIADSNLGALLALRMASPTAGVAGGLGFFGLPCGAYTLDGKTWNKTHDGENIVCAFQGVDAVDTNTMVLIGSWANVLDLDGNGVQISNDGGKTWSSHNWGYAVSARYGSFQSKDQGFVVGGDFPTTDSSSLKERISHRLTQHLTHTGSNVVYKKYEPRADEPPAGYSGIIAQGTNGGSDWNLLVNITEQGLYFNQISCTDANNCWACAEGINKTNAEPWAWIYHTSNGWKSYDIQLSVPGGSLVTIDMLSPTFGWAGGALLDSSADASYEGQFWQTKDGKTWTLYQQIGNFYVFDLSVVDEGHAYAAGTTPIGLSSFASFEASS